MTLLITFCVLLLIAYVFDLTTSYTKIPSVILLLLSGWAVRQLADWLSFSILDLGPLLPVLGTVGLILIVLEGALELELDTTKIPMIKKSIVVALVPMVVLAFAMAYLFSFIEGYTLKDSLTYAIPFCVISSAIAIPSVKGLNAHIREFVIFETSVSDILGVLFFNFLVMNSVINTDSLVEFGIEMLIITVVSIVATIGLSILLAKVKHHIKYTPIIICIILIYGVSKHYHLPALIFILIFGIVLGNLDLFKNNKFVSKINFSVLKQEVVRLRELLIEGAFLVRASFFLLFGFLMQTSEMLNLETMVYAVLVVVAIIIIRLFQLLFYKTPLMPLLFIAPRGLITILLFVAIDPMPASGIIGKSLIIQVIVLSSLVMMLGLMFTPKSMLASIEDDKEQQLDRREYIS